MYHFAVTVLLGLALFKIVDLVEDHVPALTRWHAVATMVFGVAGCYALDYSLFSGFGIGLRETWMGSVFTGLVIAGTTSVWRAAFHWLGSSEGDAPDVRHPIHSKPRMAA